MRVITGTGLRVSYGMTGRPERLGINLVQTADFFARGPGFLMLLIKRVIEFLCHLAEPCSLSHQHFVAGEEPVLQAGQILPLALNGGALGGG